MRMASSCLAAASAFLFGIGVASAQKAQDTLRIAINDAVEVFSPYDRPNEETAPFYSEVNPTFLRRDEYTDKLSSDYATSWKRIDDRTLEFEIRDGITFHSGNKLTADDIAYMVNWASDPNVKLPNKGTFLLFEGAEKTGPNTVRIRSKAVYASDLTALAYRFYVFDSQVHKNLQNTADYGRVSGSGTGPYRMASLDRNKGVVLERFEGYKGDPKYSRAPIKRIVGIPIPDSQTQQAQLITGGIDVLRNVSADTAKELAKNKELSVTSVPSGTYLYIHMDSIARSGVKELTDVRVRKAIVMAINPKEIAENFIAGADKAEIMETVCFKWTTACSWSTKPYAFNPEGAKKLLAEAGFPNGLDLQFFVHAPYKDAAEAAAGQLRKVGIRTSVQPLTISVYFKKRDEGELSLFMAVRPTGSFPEALSAFDSFFAEKRDYWRDPFIHEVWKKGVGEIDPVKRGEILKPALDRMNTEAYVLPLTSVPTVFVTSKSVRVERNLAQSGDITVSDFFWN
jgi:peptide/nickel transport system substrate-binding protein